MKWTSVMPVAVVVLSACSGDRASVLPAAPSSVSTVSSTAASSQRTSLLVMVTDDSGICLENATVELRYGLESQSVPQVTPCAVWDYDGGALFKDLAPGLDVTVRSSVTGYVPQEKAVKTSLGPQMAVILVPMKTQ